MLSSSVPCCAGSSTGYSANYFFAGLTRCTPSEAKSGDDPATGLTPLRRAAIQVHGGESQLRVPFRGEKQIAEDRGPDFRLLPFQSAAVPEEPVQCDDGEMNRVNRRTKNLAVFLSELTPSLLFRSDVGRESRTLLAAGVRLARIPLCGGGLPQPDRCG